MRDLLVATLISAFKANYNPPPKAGPSIIQSTGQWIFLRSLNILLKLKTISSISYDVLSSLYFKSAPAQKYPYWLLFKITALKLCCLFIYLIAISS